MNSESFLTAACHLLGPMGIETCMVVGGAALAHRFIASAQWRRAVWQICTLSVATLVLCEVGVWGKAPRDGLGRTSASPQESQTRFVAVLREMTPPFR